MVENPPDSLILQLLRDMRGDIAGVRTELAGARAEMATKNDIADLRSGIQSLRADVASDLLTIEKRLGEQIVGLRRAVMEYHSSAIGHGLLISEFEERLRKVEQQLGIDGAH